MTLQNAYGDQEFPVRPRWRWRWRKIVTAARQQRSSSHGNTNVFLVTLGTGVVIIAVLLGVGVLTGETINGFMQPEHVVGKLFAVFLVIAVLASIISWFIACGDGALPRREQRKYQRLAQTTPLTERQGQILALDAVSDFGGGSWNRSLEYLPVWGLLSEAMKKKHETHPEFQPFLSFELADVEALRNYLDHSQSIVSTADVERRLERALGEDSVSLKFVDLLSNPDAGNAVQRLSSLTEISETALSDLGTAPAGSPAPLLWATDVMLTIGLVRNAYVAEYIDAKRAWLHLEQLANVAFTTFKSSEEYWANARIGLAFMGNSREAVQRFDATRRKFLASNWPAVKESFPHNRGGSIPDVVRNLRAKSSL